eukprot:gene13570-19438_t
METLACRDGRNEVRTLAARGFDGNAASEDCTDAFSRRNGLSLVILGAGPGPPGWPPGPHLTPAPGFGSNLDLDWIDDSDSQRALLMTE